MECSLFKYSVAQLSNDTIVSISQGSVNPEDNITNLSPRQWYNPREISISINDTIKWTNNETEPHTVTSGRGEGLSSLLSNSQGNPPACLMVVYSMQINLSQSDLTNQELTTIFVQYILGWRV